MEYSAGRLLKNKLGLKISNTIQHLLKPSYFHKQFLQVMNNYIQVMNNYTMGKKKNQTIKSRQMYSKIVEKRKTQILIPFINFPISKTWKKIHNDILPNYYFRFFDYILIRNLMPVESNPHILLLITKLICVPFVILLKKQRFICF